MAHTVSQLANEFRAALKAQPGPAGREQVCKVLKEALVDQDFIKATFDDNTPERKILHEDPELGFCICGHVYPDEANGAPHDHGNSWAIYGVAKGDTEMTDWRIVKKAEGGSPNLVEPVRTYVMKPGDCMVYDVGAVHSPKRSGPTKLVRIEGKNLEHVQRSNIKAAQNA